MKPGMSYSQAHDASMKYEGTKGLVGKSEKFSFFRA
jgi:hypothetical protein